MSDIIFKLFELAVLIFNIPAATLRYFFNLNKTADAGIDVWIDFVFYAAVAHILDVK